MATTAKLNVVFGADLKDFQNGMAQAQRGLADFGKKMTAVGAGLTKTLTLPIVGFLGASTKAFTKQEDAERKLAAAIGATGGAVDSNMTRFKSFASEIQRLTVVGDETVLSLLQIATAQGLSADSSERAAKNAIALQSAFGVNAESAIRMTAALEQGDATMLRRYIPALKGVEDNAMAVAKAQEILTGAFSIAEAEANTFGGQVTQLKNAFGDFMEAIGSVVAEALTPFVNKAKQVLESLQGMDRELLKFRVGIAGIIAVLPIIMVAIGKLSIAFATLNRVMMANPYVLLATGIGMVLFGAFVKFREEAIKTEAIQQKINAGMEAQKVDVSDLVDSYKELNAQEAKRNLHQNVKDQADYIVALQNQNKANQETIDKNKQLISLSIVNTSKVKNAKKENEQLTKSIEENNNKLVDARQRAVDLVSAYNSISVAVTNSTSVLNVSKKTIGDLENEIAQLENSLKTVELGDLEKFGQITNTIEALETKLKVFRGELLVPLQIDTDQIIDEAQNLSDILSGDFNFDKFIDPRSIKSMQMEISVLSDKIEHSFDPDAIRQFQNEIDILNGKINELKGTTEEYSPFVLALNDITNTFVNSFGQGMANVVLQGESLVDTLKNIGKLLASAVIQKGLQLLLSGGLASAGEGFLGSGGGLLGSLFGRSGGGRVQAGQPYMTGEIGSELFIPSTNGSIISHRQLQGLGGQAQPVQVNVNVSGKISGRDLVFLVDNNRRTFN